MKTNKRQLRDEERLSFLRGLLGGERWVSSRLIQSAIHRQFQDPTYKPEMDYLRSTEVIEFEDRMEGTSHHYFYRLVKRSF